MESSLTFAFESWMICETPEDNWTGAGWAALVVVESCAGTLRAARTSTAVMVTVKNKPRELLVFIKSTPISSTPHIRASCADCQMASRVWGLGNWRWGMRDARCGINRYRPSSSKSSGKIDGRGKRETSNNQHPTLNIE